MFPLIGNIFPLQGKQFLQAKLCVSTSGENVSTTGKASVCTFSKRVSSSSNTSYPLLQPSIVPIVGKIVLQVKMWVSASEKHVSTSAKKTFIGKKMCFH